MAERGEGNTVVEYSELAEKGRSITRRIFILIELGPAATRESKQGPKVEVFKEPYMTLSCVGADVVLGWWISFMYSHATAYV
jgi:hypothetical protein